jgi:hypothetical protein
MDKIFLNLVRVFDPLLVRSGVDTVQLHEILRIKLLMDNRRPSTMFTAKRNTTAQATQSSWMVIFTTLLMGFFISIFLFSFRKPLMGQTIYFSIFMILMAITLISDFTTVLIDVRDQFIIIPRPVNDRTLTVSRILHITLYVLRQALLQAAPAFIVMIFVDGPLSLPLFFIQVMEATFLSILIVNVIYLLLMRSVSPQKFKDIISYFQIGFSIVIFGVYYLLPRLINMSALKDFTFTTHWWAYLLPPLWISALNELLIHFSRANSVVFTLAIAGLLVPLFGLWLVAKVLAPGFNRRLAMVATSDSSSVPVSQAKKSGGKGLIDRLANFLAPDPLENAGFRITWKLAARTREFKMKVYPSFAYIPIYFLYFVLNGKGQGLTDRFEKLQNSNYYIFLIYMSTFMLSAILQNVSNSEKFKSAWVYYALPVEYPGKILSGMYKAIISLYFLPYCLVLGTITIVIWGPEAINDIILASLISIIYGMLMALFMVKGLPFSRPVITKQSGGKVVVSLVILGLIAAIGYGHYLLMQWETVIWIAILPAALIVWTMFYYYKRQTWDAVESVEM